MNLSKLFELQRKLDEHIVKEKGSVEVKYLKSEIKKLRKQLKGGNESEH